MPLMIGRRRAVRIGGVPPLPRSSPGALMPTSPTTRSSRPSRALAALAGAIASAPATMWMTPCRRWPVRDHRGGR
jgi:hypothetical protein